jgi:hypothetical protein
LGFPAGSKKIPGEISFDRQSILARESIICILGTLIYLACLRMTKSSWFDIELLILYFVLAYPGSPLAHLLLLYSSDYPLELFHLQEEISSLVLITNLHKPSQNPREEIARN